MKGVTVLRGPGMKRGPGNHEYKKEKLGKIKYSFILGPKFAGFWGPETSGPEADLFSLYKNKFAGGKGAARE